MRVRPNYLFSDTDLGSNLRAQLQGAIKAVDEIHESRFKHQSDSEIAQELILRYSIRPLELKEQQRTMNREEIKIDVSGDPYRNSWQRPGPIYVNGIKVVVTTPFLGDPQLWKMRPNTYRSVFPTGEVNAHGVDGGTLDLVMERPVDAVGEQLKHELEHAFENIRFYIANQTQQIKTEFAPHLEPGIIAALTERRRRLAKHEDLSALLGIPMAPPINPPLTRPRGMPKVQEGAARRQVEWDVFISHASEDKADFVRPLADSLEAAGYRVWYDDFQLTVGDSLRQTIDRGLADSRFGVVVLSPNFLRKDWPQRELDGLVAKEVNGVKVILPVWHNITKEQLLKASPTLADKVATNSAKGLETVVADLSAAIRGDR